MRSKLEAQWGDRADSLDCIAYLRFYDPESRWECFVYACNPFDSDEACVLIHNGYHNWRCETINLEELFQNYEFNCGRKPQLDLEYRPKHLSKIYRGTDNYETY